MSRLSTRVLLREFIKTTLNEDEAGSIAGDMMSGGGGMGGGYGGMQFGSESDMYNIFVKPFVDVGKVAAGKTKEVSQSAQTALHTAFETIATTLIPFLSSDYQEIFANEKKQLDKIRSEYADVYNATWKAFRNHDALATAFMYSPVAFFSSVFAAKLPKTTMKLMSVLSGGTLDPVLAKIRDNFGMSAKKPSKSPKDFFGEAAIREDSEPQGGDNEKLVQVLSQKGLLDKLSQSQKVTSMEREGKAIVRDTLAQVFKHAQGVMGAKSLADLQKIAKKPLPGLDKLNQVPQEERQAAEQQLVMTLKKSLKLFYVKSLEAQIKQAISEGVPQDHPYIQDYNKVLSKVKAL